MRRDPGQALSTAAEPVGQRCAQPEPSCETANFWTPIAMRIAIATMKGAWRLKTLLSRC
ncbi:MAG: hypothetical protein ACYDCI_02110 [Candidatus Limnocylindrales bacterium]